MSTLIVLAKAPEPGRSKTRLTPPCSAAEAAELAEAALRDTLAAAYASGAARVLVALHGSRGDWLPPDAEVVPQRGATHAERIAAAFADAGGPAFLIGMDTPQLDPGVLDEALAQPCTFGPAADGGWWGLGLPAPDARVFAGVPMSRADTGARQLARLRELGYAPAVLRTVRDVDTAADADAVAHLAPHTRFAQRWRRRAA